MKGGAYRKIRSENGFSLEESVEVSGIIFLIEHRDREDIARGFVVYDGIRWVAQSLDAKVFLKERQAALEWLWQRGRELPDPEQQVLLFAIP